LLSSVGSVFLWRILFGRQSLPSCDCFGGEIVSVTSYLGDRSSRSSRVSITLKTTLWSAVRRATVVPVWNCFPKKLIRGLEQSEQYLVTPAFYPLSLTHPALPLFTHNPSDTIIVLAYLLLCKE